MFIHIIDIIWLARNNATHERKDIHVIDVTISAKGSQMEYHNNITKPSQDNLSATGKDCQKRSGHENQFTVRITDKDNSRNGQITNLDKQKTEDEDVTPLFIAQNT